MTRVRSRCTCAAGPALPAVFVPGWGSWWRCRACLGVLGRRAKGAGRRVPGTGYWEGPCVLPDPPGPKTGQHPRVEGARGPSVGGLEASGGTRRGPSNTRGGRP